MKNYIYQAHKLRHSLRW